jgi:hypothetical protein
MYKNMGAKMVDNLKVLLNMAYYTRGSQEVPGTVVLHCNGRTYGSAYLITFKVGPLHTHTHTCSFDPAIVGSTGRMLILESSGVWPSHSI